MRERFDLAAIKEPCQRRQVAAMRLEQLSADGRAELLDETIVAVAGDIKEELARQTIAISMQPDRGQPEQLVAGRDAAAIDNLGAIDDADDEASQIIFAARIETRHFRGLAADQRTAGF